MNFSNVVGIDGGINFIAATYDSKRKSTFVNGRAVKQKRAHCFKKAVDAPSIHKAKPTTMVVMTCDSCGARGNL